MTGKLIKFISASLLCGTLAVLGSIYGDKIFFAGLLFIPLLMIIPELGLVGAFFAGSFYGLIVNAGIMYWLYPMNYYSTHSHISSLLVLLMFSAYLAVYYGIWAFAVRAVKLPSFWKVLFAASSWVALEYFHTYCLSGLPWPVVGVWEWKNLPVIQICEYTGIFGVSFLVLLTNAAIVEFIRTKSRAMLVSIIALLVAVNVFGIISMGQYKNTGMPGLKVAVLQSSIEQYKKWDKEYENEIKAVFEALLADAVKYAPDLIVWPETSVPGIIPAEKEALQWVEETVRKTKTYNLISAPYKDDNDEHFYNSSILLDPDAKWIKIHHKTQLVPFSEYIPFRSQLVPYLGLYNAMPDLTAGKTSTVFEVKSVKFGTSLCTENFYGNMLRLAAKNGATMLFSQTNDGWLAHTNGHQEHFIFNVFRAIENRRTLVVSCNTGLSGVVSPVGEISELQPQFENRVFTVNVAPLTKITYYTSNGEVFAMLCTIVSVLLMIACLTIFRRQDSSLD